MSTSRRIVVSSAERVVGSAYSFTVQTPSSQNGSSFQGKSHVRFALEWCTRIAGTKGVIHDSLSILMCSPSIQQLNVYKTRETSYHDAILALLQSRCGDCVYGEMADSPYVQNRICGGISNRSGLVRGDMSFYLLQEPTQFRRSVFPWELDIISNFTFSLVFWVDEPERGIYPPFFHVWMMVPGGNEKVLIDFRTFQLEVTMERNSKWLFRFVL